MRAGDVITKQMIDCTGCVICTRSQKIGSKIRRIHVYAMWAIFHTVKNPREYASPTTDKSI